MAGGSEKDYKFGQKNHWRRTLWNEVLRRTGGREKSEVLIYMPGSQDLDRTVAVQKNVPSRNLIGIDRDFKNVSLIRSNGGYCIHGEVHKVLQAWPSDVRVCALMLDFNSGLVSCDWIRDLIYLLAFRRPFGTATLACNFQRGRDQASAPFRVHADDCFATGAPEYKKNRAAQFAYWMMMLLAPVIDSDPARAVMRMNPLITSYKSSGVMFDSIVVSPANDYHAPLEAAMLQDFPRDTNVVRKIAATLATRTRQL